MVDRSPKFAIEASRNIDTQYAFYYPTSKNFTTPTETVITTFQSGHGFAKTSANGTVADDTSNYILGTQSYKLTTASNGTSVFADKNISSTDIAGKYISIWVMTDDITNITELWLYLASDSAFTNRYIYKVDKDKSIIKTNSAWQRITFSSADATASGTIDEGAVTYVRVRATAANGSTVNVWFNSIAIFAEPANGVVSITFDDGLDSAYTKAASYMDKYGMRGVCYITPDNIGQSNYMTLTQVRNLAKRGWDIAGHWDSSMLSLSDAQIETNLKSVKKWIIENVPNAGVDHYAFSNGHYTDSQLNVYRKYFRSCRTIAEFSETYPPGDPMRLRIFNVTDNDSTANVAAEIDQARTNNEWLILCYHGIVDTVTDASTQTATAKFQTEIDDINTDGIKVRTLTQVLNGEIS